MAGEADPPQRAAQETASRAENQSIKRTHKPTHALKPRPSLRPVFVVRETRLFYKIDSVEGKAARAGTLKTPRRIHVPLPGAAHIYVDRDLVTCGAEPVF